MNVLKKIFSLMPYTFDNIRMQLSDGIVKGGSFRGNKYLKLNLDTAILNKYEAKGIEPYLLKGIKVFDNTTSKYINIEIEIVYGIVYSFSSSVNLKKVKPNINNIDISNFTQQFYLNEEFEAIKKLLSKEQLLYINKNDVYSILIDEEIIYHLKDLDDGDFIGVNLEKRFFIITHDPPTKSEISPDALIELFKN